MTDRDPRRRFGDRVERYTKYRPDYPREVVGYLMSQLANADSPSAADVGSGTGIFSKLLLDAGLQVTGVEPNSEMRREAERLLSGYPLFRSVDGEASRTGMDDSSVDLVCAAQAFHWFAGVETVAEFRRILRAKGIVALVWNDRKVQGDGFHEGYEEIVRGCPEYTCASHKGFTFQRLSGIFDDWKHGQCGFANRQRLDFNSLLGRLESSSYCPLPGSADHERIVGHLKDLFDSYEYNNSITLEYTTDVHIFRTNP